MIKRTTVLIYTIIAGICIALYAGCDISSDKKSDKPADLCEPVENPQTVDSMGTSANIIFLHHSTGGGVWGGGVPEWFDNYNSTNGTTYSIIERAYPKDEPYGWANYPFDYYNIWVAHEGEAQYMTEDTLELLTDTYNVIIWKHCFPVSDIGDDSGPADVNSSEKTIGNYQEQYNALKEKMHEFPSVRFIVWTGAALVADDTDAASAVRARDFFTWVKETWDQPLDNIYVWDFFELETEGGNVLLGKYASGDSHPNNEFNQYVAPLFSQRIVDVIQGNGDARCITGGE